MDGDDQHDPTDIPRLVRVAQEERADLVIGTREVRMMPPKSEIGNFSRFLFFIGTSIAAR